MTTPILTPRFQQTASLLQSKGYTSSIDIAQVSFPAFYQACSEFLSWHQASAIYHEAKQYTGHLHAHQRKILTHANPQFRQAMHLAIDPLSDSRGYEQWFGRRAEAYVNKNAVASMFSPAAYLTELYREGEKLYLKNHTQSLDKRRPDLQALTLSQGNMESEISTLALSNEILSTAINETELDAKLAQRLYPFDLPWHAPFSTLESVLRLHSSSFAALAERLEASMTEMAIADETCAAFANRLSPGLAQALITPIPGDATEVLQQHFDTTDVAALCQVTPFCQRTGISRDRLSTLLSLRWTESGYGSKAAQFTTEPIPAPPGRFGSRYLIQNNDNFICISADLLQFDHSSLTPATPQSGTACYLVPTSRDDQLGFTCRLQERQERLTEKPASSGPVKLAVLVNDKTVEQRGVNHPYDHWFSFSVPLNSVTTGKIRIKITAPSEAGELITERELNYDKVLKPVTAAPLVRLSQLIRYSQATGLSPATLDTLIVLSSKANPSAPPAITQATLTLTGRVVQYRARYGLSEEDAVVLAGGEINPFAPEGTINAFDRLFNDPLLNGQAFTISEEESSLDLRPEQAQNAFERAVLKRALGVNDTDLLLLATVVNRDPDPAKKYRMRRNLANLSNLYRAALLARALQVSLPELETLLQCLGRADTPHDLAHATPDQLAQTLSRLEQTLQWLRAHTLPVAALSAMTTRNYPATMTQEIKNFLHTLYHAGQNSSTQAEPTGDELKERLAPHIAADLGLVDRKVARWLEEWVEQVAADQGLTLTRMQDYWQAIKQYCRPDNPDTSQEASLAAFTQALGQLALIIKTWQCTAPELSLLLKQPAVLPSPSPDKLPLTPDMLLRLSQFKALQQGVGEGAEVLLSQLNRQALDPVTLAHLLKQPEAEVKEAIKAIKTSTPDSLTAVQGAQVVDWLQAAQSHGVSVANVRQLLTARLAQDFSVWKALADAVQAGVPASQKAAFDQAQDEALSTALCAYFLACTAPALSLPKEAIPKNRDELFQYLLIDNQVSGQVQTTRIAEAISSLQLYIHRCLQGMETSNITNLRDTRFFQDWDHYNRRYSTWAGVSQLVYYPENYIDPALRYNQSPLQQQLNTEISQSQLNKESVEQAYRNYLSGFEEVANLKVLCGYQDAATLDSGCSYFTGRSTSQPYRYYWRSLDNTASDGTGGFVASAWRAWEAIQSSVSPFNDEIRPVLLNDRLYIGWIEKQIEFELDAKNPTAAPKQKAQYNLALSYRKINGNWSPAMRFPQKIPAALITQQGQPAFNLYLSYYPELDAILFILYNPDDVKKQRPADPTPQLIPKDKTICSVIYGDMRYEEITDPKKWAYLYGLVSNNLNLSTQENRLIRRLNINYPVTVTATNDNYIDPNWVILDPNQVEIVNYKTDDASAPLERVTLSYTAQATFDTKNKNPLGSLENDLVTVFQDNALRVTKHTAEFSIENNLPLLTVTLTFQATRALNPADFLVFNVAAEKYLDPGDISLTPSGTTWILSFTEQDPVGRNDQAIYHITAVTDEERHPYFEGRLAIVYYYIGQLSYTWTVDGDTRTVPPLPLIKRKLNSLEVFKKEIPIPDPLKGFTQTCTFRVMLQGSQGDFSKVFTLNVTENEINPVDCYQIVEGVNKAQYLESPVHPRRTRLNTLFANQLIERSQASLDQVLSRDTQRLPEPQMGRGAYVKLVFSPYDPITHGSSKGFEIEQCKVYSASSEHCVDRGVLDVNQTERVLFLPSVGAPDKDLYLLAHYKTGKTNDIRFKWDEKSKSWRLDPHYNEGRFSGLMSAEVLKRNSDPMDFNGANGLYFWELFYYTPMLVTDKSLQAQHIDEAERWLKYVFNLASPLPWNARPLEEDSSWNLMPKDHTDPDVVAQADPMHYKVATYMKLLDLLIARGDRAYRQLERDTLAEAKMWYVTALNLLGPAPDLPLIGDWSDPTLAAAASPTLQNQRLRAMAQLVAGASPLQVTEGVGTANSLTYLFLPAENDKLKGYWQTLHQRLYNLRHHLSIDGQPLTLPLYATPADPKALQSAAAAASAGGASALPTQVSIALQRFPLMLESARALVSQLIQYGSTLAAALERKDGEALSLLMQTQGQALMLRSLQLQDKTVAQLKAEQRSLAASLAGAQARRNSYQQLLNEGINGISIAEILSAVLRTQSSAMGVGANVSRMASAAADMVPNIYGFACGGSRWGALPAAIASGMDAAAVGLSTVAEALTTSEQYRRRAQEWTIQRDAAQHDMEQIVAQQASLQVQIEAAQLQKGYLQAQQAQGQAQLDFLKTKFSNQALYSWMQGRLSALFYQFYDLTVTRCLKAQLGYQWETGKPDTFIQPGAWDSNHAGLLCGEALMLNLTQLEAAWLAWDKRALEVSRTVSMAQAMQDALGEASFNAKVKSVLETGETFGKTHTLALNKADDQFIATLNLSALDLKKDYPDALGTVRRIRQVSVSLPALLGPYQDIQAVLAYSGQGKGIHQSCRQAAVSQGVNDSGLFQLDFNDGRYLPFEGLPIGGEDNKSSLTLSFPNATGRQRALLGSLNDIVLHIRYTLRD